MLHEMAHGIMGHQVGEKSSAQRELEADLLSMMLCNRYGIEVTDARIDHMVNSFHAFTNEQKSVENPVQLVNLIESVNQLFERHESALQKAMEKAGIQLQMEQTMTAAPQMSKTQEKENLPLQERQEHKTVVVNLIAGPGAGKTTCAWEIAEKLKKQGYVAEYVSEVAKEYVWDERYDLLDGSFEHQKSLFDEQKHRIDRLIGKVDFVVTDSPLILNSVYLAEGLRPKRSSIGKWSATHSVATRISPSSLREETLLSGKAASIPRTKVESWMERSRRCCAVVASITVHTGMIQ